MYVCAFDKTAFSTIEKGIEANANASRLRKLPKWGCSNQLKIAEKRGGSVVGDSLS